MAGEPVSTCGTPVARHAGYPASRLGFWALEFPTVTGPMPVARMLEDLEVTLRFLAGIRLTVAGYLGGASALATDPDRGGCDLAGPHPPRLIRFEQSLRALVEADVLLALMFRPLDHRKAIA